MSVVTELERFTPEDLLVLPDGDRFELVDGRLVELPMSALSSMVAARVNRLIGIFVDAANLGMVFQSDCSYQCFPDAPDCVRQPAGSFIRHGRLPLEQLE